MRRRTLAALLCVTLVALAGCSGGDGPGASTATEDPAETDAPAATDTPQGTGDATEDDGAFSTPTADPEPLALSSVRTDAGLNTSAVLLAHSRALERSGGYRIETNRTVRDDEFTAIKKTTGVGTTAPLRYLYRVNRTQIQPSGPVTDRTARYHTPDRIYRRADVGGDDEPPRHWTNGSSRASVGEQFQHGTVGFTEASFYLMYDFEFAGNVTRDGRTLYRFTADSFDDTGNAPRTATEPDATLLVDRYGVIRRFRMHLAYEATGETLDQSMRTTAVGDVTVEEPDWTDEAEARTGG